MKHNYNKNRKIQFCFSILFAMLLWLPAKINAQEAQGIRLDPAASFSLEPAASAFSYLSGGTVVPSLSADDAVSTALPIGFTFSMGISTYTTFFASSNGTISFNNATSATSPALIGSTPVLAPLWSDLNGNAGTFSYSTTGTAPNRVLTAEWKNWKWNYQATGATISFQVKLYEGTNTIEYIYNPEAAAITGGATYNAAIGLYNNMDSANIKQLWLSGSTSSPTTSTTISRAFSTKPESGQLYRFNFINANYQYYGQTVINPAGGFNSTDGLKISLSGTGVMQIYRNNITQIYASGGFNNMYFPKGNVPNGTTNPINETGTTNGIVLSVGSSAFNGGSLKPGGSSYDNLKMVSSTQQSLIETSPGHFVDVIKMTATKNSLVYGLEVTYTYNYPSATCLIDYKVTIPPGNTEKVQLAHGWDTFLQGNDQGPGFKTGTAADLSDAVVGVARTPVFEAFQYLGGVKWTGYYSAIYSSLNSNLGGTPYMAFKNTIDPAATTDNGIGISMNFGSTPGTYESNNAVIFACAAGDIAPTLSGTTANPCAGSSFNLNSYLTSTPPAGTVVQWRNAGGTLVADPTNVSIAGAYTATYFSSVYSCSSPGATITVTYNAACTTCYKPAVTTGTSSPFKIIISTLDRISVPRNFSDPRTGSLILESTNKGFVLTRVASTTAITNPIEGMLVYDTTANALKLYNGTIWKVLEQGCPD